MAKRRQDEKRCEPGSIEQHLDMCESGELRGDEVEHNRDAEGDPLRNYQMDMSEEDREGDEASGDEHSDGLQAGEPEMSEQPQVHTGLPGDETRHEELEEEDRKRRSAA